LKLRSGGGRLQSEPAGVPLSFGSSNQFLPENKTTITNYLKALYFSASDTTRGILEDAALLNGGQIRIYQTSSVAGFAPFLGTTPTGAIGLNLNVISHSFVINELGRLVPFSPELAIIHELTHAVRGTFDLVGAAGPLNTVTQADFNSPSFDLAGDTLKIQNTIAAEPNVHCATLLLYRARR
jgi:hypothetical protein